tara:strand:+ start:10518 stop:11150 length:633 start_codon:yes stop_codon:yes gene_type:complete
MNLVIPKNLKKVREVSVTPDELIQFELNIKEKYEQGKIRGPVHLSKNNEQELIEIFKYIDKEDWVFVPWRNHYHAILHGVDKNKLHASIMSGNSMHTNNINPNFYSSSIVGGIIPLATGVAMALKRIGAKTKVWCFVGDMTRETGTFHESYKYTKNFELPIQWVIEDNGVSVHTQTESAWGKHSDIPDDVLYYKYDMVYPHHGTGKWVNF